MEEKEKEKMAAAGADTPTACGIVPDGSKVKLSMYKFTDGPSTGKHITFVSRWVNSVEHGVGARFEPTKSKSYTVTLEQGIAYKNDRQPHVVTPWEGLEGNSFVLGHRTIFYIKGKAKACVMYQIEGLPEGTHLTVYDGPEDGTAGY